MYRPDGPVELRPVGEVEWLMLDSRVVDVRMVRSNRTKVRKVSSCKFSGGSLSLRSSLLGKPQLLPLLIEFDHF